MTLCVCLHRILCDDDNGAAPAPSACDVYLTDLVSRMGLCVLIIIILIYLQTFVQRLNSQ